MKASIVVCVYNRASEIVRCLESLVALDLEGCEVVVVDDGSSDGSRQVVEAFVARGRPGCDRIRLVANARNLGVSGARNAGVDASRGALVLFTDSDCVVRPGWIDAYLEAFAASPGLGAASGPVSEPEPTTLAELAYGGSGVIRASTLQRRRLMGCNMAFRRRWLAAHRFDEALDYGSDEDEIAWRLARDGLRVGFVEDARVEHHHRVDLRGYLREGYRLGRGAARFGYKRGHGLGHDLWLLTASLLCLPWAGLAPAFGVASAVLAGGQVAAIAFNEWRLKGKDLWTTLRVLPLACLYYGAKAAGAYGTWARLLVGGESAIRASRRRDRVRLRSGRADPPARRSPPPTATDPARRNRPEDLPGSAR